MTGAFITSTGTGIGKTYLMQQLLQHDSTNYKRFQAIKPVISGWSENENEIRKSDTGILLQAQSVPLTLANIDAISPWRFKAPLTPSLAAQKEGAEIKFRDLYSFCLTEIEKGKKAQKITLIEGAGGLMSPIGNDFTGLEWMASLKSPALLVVGSYLGSLSHTLTAVLSLQFKKIPLLGIVINETPGSNVSCADTAKSLSGFIGSIPLWQIPYQPNVTCNEVVSLYKRFLSLDY